MNKKLLVTLGTFAVVGVGCTTAATHAATSVAAHAAVTPAVVAAYATTPPAPTTAAGYAHAFATLPTGQWGAADVALTVPLSTRGLVRTVWLFGDTLSTSRFVHSTAIIQTGGRFYVSHQGAQLLPNDDASHIYWILSGRLASAGSLLVTARSIHLTGTGAWAFADDGFSRTALVHVGTDLTFVRWVSRVYGPMPDQGPLYAYGPHHFGYSRHVHHELKLTGGQVLVTTCQNWDDGVLHPFAAYRPIFTSIQL